MIVVDSREPQSYLEELVRRLPSVTCSTLSEGDYLWTREGGGRVLVERKSILDLLSSLMDGRWASQLPRILDDVDLPVLLIEGNFLIRADGLLTVDGRPVDDWTITRLDNALLIGQAAGIILARCSRGTRAVSDRIISLYEATTSGEHKSLVNRSYRAKGFSAEEIAAINVLCGLPGCGVKTAKMLLKEFGTVWEVMEHVKSGTGVANLRGISKERAGLWQRAITQAT